MKFRRRRYLIDTGFQSRIIFTFMIVSLAGCLAAVAAFNFFALKELESLMWSIHIKAASTGDLFKPLFFKINTVSFIFVCILLIVIALWMMRKASGPIYRMSKDIMKAAEGDLTIEITLRQKDEFKDTAQELDGMIRAFRERFRSINEKHQKLSEALEHLNINEVKEEDYKSLLLHIAQVESELGKFRMSG